MADRETWPPVIIAKGISSVVLTKTPAKPASRRPDVDQARIANRIQLSYARLVSRGCDGVVSSIKLPGWQPQATCPCRTTVEIQRIRHWIRDTKLIVRGTWLQHESRLPNQKPKDVVAVLSSAYW